MSKAIINLLLATALSGCFTGGCFTGGGLLSGPSQSYVVRPGDTVYELAKRYGSSVDAIIETNDIDDVRELKIGQRLLIPTASHRPPAEIPAKKSAPSPLRPDPNPRSLKTVKLSQARRYVGHLHWPVSGGGGRVGSPFGWRWLSFHEGIDISAPEGTDITAAHDGEIVYSSDGLNGYGNLIVLKGDGFLTVYGHNRKNDVRQGERVKTGQKIAEVGQTGHASGPHLHFETRIKTPDGKYTAVDPMVFFAIPEIKMASTN